MAKKITLQQNDNGMKLILVIKKDSLIEPLTGAKVLIKFKNKATGYEFDRYAKITDENNAECEYVFTEKDLALSGTYVTEVETTYGNGTVISLPNQLIIVVQEEIFNKTNEINLT